MNIPAIRTTLEAVQIPQTGRTLGGKKAVQAIEERSDGLYITPQLDFPVNYIGVELANRVQEAVIGIMGDAHICLSINTVIGTHKMQPGVAIIKGVKNTIAVVSGEGGVGESTTITNLTTAITRMGARVSVLDADPCGSSRPTMLGVQNREPNQQNQKLISVEVDSGIQVMPVGFLIDADQVVVWRGPMVSQVLQQLVLQSGQDDMDCLFIGLPSGTDDAQFTLSQKTPVTGSAVVTMPQDVTLINARKTVDMFNKVNIPILGVLESMLAHIRSNYSHAETISGPEGGKNLAGRLDVSLPGQLPLSLPVREAMDSGSARQFLEDNPAIAEIYTDAASRAALATADKSKDFSSRSPKIVVE